MSRLIRLAAVAATVALALTGCGKDPAQPSGGADPGSGAGGGKKFREIKACEVYTLDDAKKFLGDSAEKADPRVQTEMAGPDVFLSTCTYQREEGSDLHLLTILVRAPSADSGPAGNAQAYENAKTESANPANIQDVTGYGEKAFYDKGLKQLAVLKNGVFLIFTPPDESADPVADSKRIADVVLPRI